VAGSTHEIRAFYTLLVHGWKDLRIGIDGRWFNMRPSGATRGKWRILDGKVSEWSVFMFGALKLVAPACVD
jgi:hypothetical protein